MSDKTLDTIATITSLRDHLKKHPNRDVSGTLYVAAIDVLIKYINVLIEENNNLKKEVEHGK